VLAALKLLELTGAKLPTLEEKLVNEAGLAVVNVGDDGDVADAMKVRHKWAQKFGPRKAAGKCRSERKDKVRAVGADEGRNESREPENAAD